MYVPRLGRSVLAIFVAVFLTLPISLCIDPQYSRAQEESTTAPTTAPTNDRSSADGQASAAESSGTETLPSDFNGLVNLKTKRIGEYQQVANGSSREAAAEKLAEVVEVELALLKLAEDQLGEVNKDLANTYRATAQNDGALLASELYLLSDYAQSAQVYETVLGIARRRSDLSLETFNDLVALSLRAKRLAASSEEELAEYQTAIENAGQALALAESQQFEKASTLLAESIEVQKRIAGTTPHLAGEYGRCAAWLKKCEKLEDAEDYYRMALDAFDSTVGRETLRYASILYNLGVMLEEQKRYEEADELLSQTRMIENRIGVDLKSQLMTLNELAGLYRLMETPEKFNEVVGAYRFLEARSSLGLEALAPFLPVDAYMAASVSPAAIVQAPELDNLPHELFRSFVNENLGIDPIDVESLVLFLTLPFDEEEANWGVLVKTVANQPLNLNLGGEQETLEDSGFEYSQFRSAGEQPVCVATLSEGLFVAGNRTSVQQVLAVAAANSTRGAKIGKLANQLLSLHGGGEMIAATDFSKLQVILQAMIEEIPPLPGALDRIRSLPTQLDAVGMTVSLSESPYFSVMLEPRADVTPEAIADTVNEAMRNGAELVVQEISRTANGASDLTNGALQKYMARIVNTKLEGLLATVEGGQVVLRLESAFEFQGPVLTALLLPAVQAARDAAQRMEGMNNLKMLGLAFWNYHDTHGHFPTRQIALEDGGAGLSWRVQILPFLDQLELYEQFHLDEPWDSEHNLELVERMPEYFRTPGLDLEPGKTNLLTLAGPGTAMEDGVEVKARDIVDGLSNTILVVEANPDRAVVWTKPEDLPFDPESPGIGLGEARLQGFNMLMTDGAVRFQASDASLDQLKGMATRAGGELVQ